MAFSASGSSRRLDGWHGGPQACWYRRRQIRAEEAEAIADTEASFDLIVCSVVMELGGDTGIHLAEHIEFSKRTNSTLLVSHFAPELLRHIPGFSRQRHFLANPFTAEELLSRVRDLLVAKTN